MVRLYVWLESSDLIISMQNLNFMLNTLIPSGRAENIEDALAISYSAIYLCEGSDVPTFLLGAKTFLEQAKLLGVEALLALDEESFKNFREDIQSLNAEVLILQRANGVLRSNDAVIILQDAEVAELNDALKEDLKILGIRSRWIEELAREGNVIVFDENFKVVSFSDFLASIDQHAKRFDALTGPKSIYSSLFPLLVSCSQSDDEELATLCRVEISIAELYLGFDI